MAAIRDGTASETAMIDLDRTDDLLAVAWMAMRQRGMKQKTLAAELGITEKHMSHLFRGHAQPSIAMLRRILAVFDMELVAQPIPSPSQLSPVDDPEYRRIYAEESARVDAEEARSE
jgi:transcriptional regulator with XRE-family HTH domain